MKLATPGTVQIKTKYGEVTAHEDTDLQIAQLEKHIGSVLGARVHKEYPNMPWEVRVNAEAALVILTSSALSAEKGYHIPMRNMNIHQLEEKIVYAASRVLEMHGLPRKRSVGVDDVMQLKVNPIKPNEVVVSDAEPELDHGISRL